MDEDSSLQARFMAVDDILQQLASMKDNAESFVEDKDTEPYQANIWQQDIAACEAATAVLSALQDEGVEDADGVKDLIHEYRSLADQHKKMHQKFCVAKNPVRKDGLWHCPECNHRISYRHGFCHWCGKKIGGW
jgi:rubrerythrin